MEGTLSLAEGNNDIRDPRGSFLRRPSCEVSSPGEFGAMSAVDGGDVDLLAPDGLGPLPC